MGRKEDIRSLHKQYSWHYHVLLYGIVLIAGILVGAYIFRDRDGYDVNVWTEALGVAAGAGVTLFVLERLDQRRERRILQRRLVREVGSGSNDFAKNAVSWLRTEGWFGGENGILKNQDLRGANLEGVFLWDWTNEGEAVTGVNLEKSNLVLANLKNADLRKACLKNTYLYRAEMEGANFADASLQEAILDTALMQRARFFKADLTGASLELADLRCADLGRASIKNANLKGARLQNANSQWANYDGSDLHSANFSGARLNDASFRHAHLANADFSDADLRDADLSWADLNDAVFSEGTNLTGATLPDGKPFTDTTCMKKYTVQSRSDFFGTSTFSDPD